MADTPNTSSATTKPQVTFAASPLKTAAPSKRQYKLLIGKHTYIDETGKVVVARKGELVPLTEQQFKDFKGKFAVPTIPEPQPKETAREETQGQTAA